MFAELKLFFTGAKGMFYLVMIVLTIICLTLAYCSHESHLPKPPPVVTVNTTPDLVPDITPKIEAEHSDAVVGVEQHEAVTTQTVTTVETTTKAKIRVIRSNKSLSVVQVTQQVGEAQLAQIDQLYAKFYPKPASDGSGTVTPQVPSTPAPSTSLNTITLTLPISAKV